MKRSIIAALGLLGCGNGVHSDPNMLTGPDAGPIGSDATAGCNHATIGGSISGTIGGTPLLPVATACQVQVTDNPQNPGPLAYSAILLASDPNGCPGYRSGDTLGLVLCNPLAVGTFPGVAEAGFQCPGSEGMVVGQLNHSGVLPPPVAGGSVTITTTEGDCVGGSFTIMFQGSGTSVDTLTGTFSALKL